MIMTAWLKIRLDFFMRFYMADCFEYYALLKAPTLDDWRFAARNRPAPLRLTMAALWLSN
jgi:hypothetical protein